MSWTYSGDPSTSPLDKYRFLIGDTIEEDGLLQDAEINFVMSNNTNENYRLAVLFHTSASRFARQATKRSLGPMSEETVDRLNYFNGQAKFYRKKAAAVGISIPEYSSDILFSKGMHSNV